MIQAGTKRVLIVDDEPAIAELVAIILGGRGFEVTVASSGHEGLDRVGESTPDLIITDMIMPDMEGIEFLRALRKGGINVSVIVMSGDRVGQQFFEAARLLGAKARLQKPFSGQQLLETVTRIL
jgi:CheY-like chemotaxis protein